MNPEFEDLCAGYQPDLTPDLADEETLADGQVDEGNEHHPPNRK